MIRGFLLIDWIAVDGVRLNNAIIEEETYIM